MSGERKTAIERERDSRALESSLRREIERPVVGAWRFSGEKDRRREASLNSLKSAMSLVPEKKKERDKPEGASLILSSAPRLLSYRFLSRC